MSKPKSFKYLVLAAFAACWLPALRAEAHISMVGAIQSRGGDQKAFPCDGSRGDGPTYTFEPGATIALTVSEDIPHPSYFRIAFDTDPKGGSFVEPKSIKPIDPMRACPFDSNDKCGEADYCNKVSTNGPTVLWDDIEPHLAGSVKQYTWNLKLPDVECESCVIQILQIMEDTVHGAYCPTGSCMDNSLEDIYHRCIDITLKKGATNSPGTTTAAPNIKGMECAAAQPGSMAGAGGATATGGAAAPSGGASGGSAAGSSASAGSSAGAAGTATAGSSTSGAAGTHGSNAAGTPATPSTTTPTGAAGMGARDAGVGTTQSAATGSAGTAPTGTSSTAGSVSTSSPASPPSSGGGCSVAFDGRDRSANLPFALACVGVFGLLGRRSMKRRSAARA